MSHISLAGEWQLFDDKRAHVTGVTFPTDLITALHAGRQRVELVLPSLSYQSGREPEASRTMSSTKGFAFESRSTAEKKKKKKTKRSSKQKEEL